MASTVAAHVVRAPLSAAAHAGEKRIQERSLPRIEVLGVPRGLIEVAAKAHPVYDVADFRYAVGLGRGAREMVVVAHGADGIQLRRPQLLPYSLGGL